jgi:glycosyltransferase involved in cell wall biosynthesis
VTGRSRSRRERPQHRLDGNDLHSGAVPRTPRGVANPDESQPGPVPIGSGSPPRRLHRIALVTMIYPPDIGGPATHAQDLRDELAGRGHELTVVTLTDRSGREQAPGIVRFPRRWPWPLRLLAVSNWLVAHRTQYDVIYATGLLPAAVAGGRIAARPVVVKVVGDMAWERGTRLGLVTSTFDEFQRQDAFPVSVAAMRWLQKWSLLHASAITAPSQYLVRVVENWLGGPSRVVMISNGVAAAHTPDAARPPASALEALFIGRLVPIKRVDRILQAVSTNPRVSLTIVGDGPEKEGLHLLTKRLGLDDRVRFTGSLPRDGVIRCLTSADVLVLSSEHEGLPHVAIEALACGIPVVAARAGGIGEVVSDNRTGLIVDPENPRSLPDALMRLQSDRALLNTLRGGAQQESHRWQIERTADQVEALLGAVRRGRPRAIFIGKTGVPSRPGEDIRRKFEILLRHVVPTFVVSGRPGWRYIGTTRVISLPALNPPAVGGLLFYSIAPFVGMGLALTRRRPALVCQSPYEAFGPLLLSQLLPRELRPKVAVEVHGDWRTAPRLYGSRARTLIAPFSDRLAAWALQRADRIRAVGNYTEDLVKSLPHRGEMDRFLAFSDFATFLGDPPTDLPRDPNVAFVGVLERYKGIDVLIDAWPSIVEREPASVLWIAGDGTLRPAIQRAIGKHGIDASVRLLGRISRAEVKDVLDRSRMLVLPSRSEGLGLVILEAFSRGRPVVATEVGGIRELVIQGRTGLLVPPEDKDALALGILKLLGDAVEVRRMGREARRVAERRNPLVEFEAGIRRLAEWIEGG